MSVATRQPLIAAVAFLAIIGSAPAIAQGDVSFPDRANAMVQQSAPTAPAAAHPARDVAAKAADQAEAVEVNYGADPDPEHFDRVGVERWWAKYSKAHPAR